MNDHAHHWLIDSPSGPTSHGRCLLCGAERDFSNCPPRDVRSETSAWGNRWANGIAAIQETRYTTAGDFVR